jgi:hypothetical protein
LSIEGSRIGDGDLLLGRDPQGRITGGWLIIADEALPRAMCEKVDAGFSQKHCENRGI